MPKKVNGLFVVPTTVYDYLELISVLAIDYDGYRKAESLMELIDEMAGYARAAIQLMIDNGELDDDKVYSGLIEDDWA